MNTEMKRESSNDDILLELRNKYEIAKLLKSEIRHLEMRKIINLANLRLTEENLTKAEIQFIDIIKRLASYAGGSLAKLPEKSLYVIEGEFEKEEQRILIIVKNSNQQ